MPTLRMIRTTLHPALPFLSEGMQEGIAIERSEVMVVAPRVASSCARPLSEMVRKSPDTDWGFD